MFDASRALVAVLNGEIRTANKSVAGRVATVLLLANADGELLRAAVDGLVHERFRVDQDLIRQIYWSAPRATRASLGAAAVVSHVAPVQYRRIWSDALCAAHTSKERMRLAQCLDGFLVRNPSEAEHFAKSIRRLLRDDSVTVRNIGLVLLAALNNVTTVELAQVARGLSSRIVNTRLFALGALQRWLIRADEVAPEVVAFARSDAAIAAATLATKHEDAAVRMAARNYLRILRRRIAAWRASSRQGTPAAASRRKKAVKGRHSHHSGSP